MGTKSQSILEDLPHWQIVCFSSFQQDLPPDSTASEQLLRSLSGDCEKSTMLGIRHLSGDLKHQKRLSIQTADWKGEGRMYPHQFSN